jgi:transcriptional regulator with XRE-family HTH domain
MDMRRLVGRNVKRLREKKGLTQEQFADISGFSQQYLSSLERGRRNPTIITLYEISTALGVSHIDPAPSFARRAGRPTPVASNPPSTAIVCPVI